MTNPLSVQAAHRRFLILTALRWLPVGLVIPVTVLLPLERGLSLSQVGIAASVQGFVVLGLELPTGGLADSIGRRRVLLLSALVGLVALGVLLVADSLAAFVVVSALQGVYRALDSGPLEAWYVDATLAVNPKAPIERGLSGSSVVLGLAVAVGALASGGLVALDPLPSLNALVVPVVVAVGLQAVGLVGLVVLMIEHRPIGEPQRVGSSAAGAMQAIAEGGRLLRRSPILLALVAVELSWGFGMVTFEGLLPVRLGELVGDADQAAAITGPASSGAWVVMAAGAACMPWLGRRIGIAPTAALMRVGQGVTVAGMGLFGGVAGVITAYLACYAIHGASNPAHMTLLHRQVEGPVRATVVSLNSMVSQPAGAVGLIALTALADAQSVSWAMYVGGAVLALAAPLYLPAWRQARRGAAAEAVSRT